MSDQWGWYVEGYSAKGPFDSRDEAVRNAEVYYAGDKPGTYTVHIGQIVEVKAEDWIDCDIDRILERMDERIGNEVEVDDFFFAVDDDKLEEAEIALRIALKTWAQKWVDAEMDWYVGQGEEIPVPLPEPAAPDGTGGREV